MHIIACEPIVYWSLISPPYLDPVYVDNPGHWALGAPCFRLACLLCVE